MVESGIKQKVVRRLLGGSICPKCNIKIDSLTYFSKVETSQDFELDEKGRPHYSGIDEYGDHSDDQYACPECYEVLFTEEHEVVKFLGIKR